MIDQFLPRVTVDGQYFQPASKNFSHTEANRLLDEGYLEIETGYARLDNGMLFVASLTDMLKVTGEMIV